MRGEEPGTEEPAPDGSELFAGRADDYPSSCFAPRAFPRDGAPLWMAVHYHHACLVCHQATIKIMQLVS